MEPRTRIRDDTAAAVRRGGADVVEIGEADGLVWIHPHKPRELGSLLEENPQIRWVQLPYAGVEDFVHLVDDKRVWTCGKDVYSEPVAEHVVTLALAGFRGLGTYARASDWSRPRGRNLLGARIMVLGGGGITRSLLRLLEPWGTSTTVLRRSARPIEGADRVGTLADLHDVLPETDLLVLALALTPETHRVIGSVELDLLPDHAWLVNVARGAHVDTAALVAALERKAIGGAALDVTDPEPLPAGHRLWGLDNCIITPHIANTPEMGAPLLHARIAENVRRFREGRELVGPIDPALGY